MTSSNDAIEEELFKIWDSGFQWYKTSLVKGNRVDFMVEMQDAIQEAKTALKRIVYREKAEELKSHIERESGVAGTIHMERHEVEQRLATLQGLEGEK